MALQPLRKPKQITAKQSADFVHDSVYSPQNHVDTYFSNMSGTGSHKWARRRMPALKYDVDLQRLHHKRGKLTQASCASAKSDGGVRGVRRRNGWGGETLRNWNWDSDFCGFTVILVGDPWLRTKIWPLIRNRSRTIMFHFRWLLKFLHKDRKTHLSFKHIWVQINPNCSERSICYQTEDYTHSLGLLSAARGTYCSI